MNIRIGNIRLLPSRIYGYMQTVSQSCESTISKQIKVS